MLSLATAIHDEIAEALSPMEGGLYRVEDVSGSAKVPGWWLRADSSATLNPVQDSCLLSLDIWHASVGDLDEALGKVEFLRDWKVYGVGTYTRQSINVQHEDQGVHHGTVLLSCIAFSGVAA